MNKKFYFGLGFLFTLSISLFIFDTIYQGSLPKIVEEINNSSIGAILTAIVTVLLLSQQSSSEEIKERNVRVFEEKSNRFKIFIDQLWDIWEDRVVTLEELNELIKIVSKDIVLYTKTETVSKILDNLTQLSEEINPEKTHFEDQNSKERIQRYIFSIINELAKDMNLGGELSDENITKLNQLEKKILPMLVSKKFRKEYIEFFIKFFENYQDSNDDIFFDKVEFREEDKCFWCRINHSSVYYKIGPMERSEDQVITFGFYSEFYANRQYTKYRHAVRGVWKDYLGCRNWNSWNFSHLDKAVNFLDREKVESGFYKFDSKRGDEITKTAMRILDDARFDGKTLSQLIEECENISKH